MRRMTSLLTLYAFAACGPWTRPGHGGPDDAQHDDATVPDAPDAAVDPPEQPPPTPSRDLVGGAGRLSSATYTFDIEIGHPVSQQPASGATYTIQGNAAIKP
jgi:hypothetical protein